MKNQNTIAYYEKLRELFPKINFKEGRFLRDFKFCLIEFERQHPKCTYEDVVKEFSTPEENVHNYIMGEDFEYFFALLKKKSYKALSVISVVMAFSLGAFLVFRWALNDKLETQRSELLSFSNRIEKVIEHIDACVTDIGNAQGMNQEDADYWKYSPENTLRSTLESCGQAQEVLGQMRTFSDYYVEMSEKYLLGNGLEAYDLSLVHEVTGELEEGLRVFQNFLDKCIMKEVYLEEPELLKKYLSQAKEEFVVIQNSLEVHDFSSVKSAKEWMAYYYYFLDDATDYQYDIQGWLEDCLGEMTIRGEHQIFLNMCEDLLTIFSWPEYTGSDLKFQKAFALRELGRTKEALQFCKEWIEKETENIVAATMCVHIFIETKEFEVAEQLVNKFIFDKSKCQDDNEIMFAAASKLYKAMGKEKEKQQIDNAIVKYEAYVMQCLENPEFDADDVEFWDEDDLPFN